MGNAVCDGEVLYATQWKTPGTNIQLVLRGENSECILTVLYLSQDGMRQILEDRIEKQKQES